MTFVVAMSMALRAFARVPVAADSGAEALTLIRSDSKLYQQSNYLNNEPQLYKSIYGRLLLHAVSSAKTTTGGNSDGIR